jgi:hypothetical protein
MLESTTIPKRTPDEVCVWTLVACMEAYTGKIKNGGNSIRLNHITREILWPFEI